MRLDLCISKNYHPDCGVEAMELQVRQQLQSVQQVPDEERATLDGIEQLLQETRQLLELTDTQADDNAFGQELAA